MSTSSDVIDLTNNSFCLANHCGLANSVIVLDSDDSICVFPDSSTETSRDVESRTTLLSRENRRSTSGVVKKKKKTLKELYKQRKSDTQSSVAVASEKKDAFGGCPICWDNLGANPLASTKCGHVFCLKCIEEYVRHEKKCPTCRKSLKGSTAYHPLYLSRE